MSNFKWTNIFIRDILLSIVIIVVNFYANFNSWFAAFAAGMVVVLTTWHLSDLIKLKRRLNGINRFSSYNFHPARYIPDNIQQSQRPEFKGLFGRT